MNKKEIIDKLMKDDHLEDWGGDYIEDGLMVQTKQHLLNLLYSVEGEQ